MPSTNTMIAFNVSRDRRGTAFVVGAMGATMFGRFSLKAGFATVGMLMLGLAALVAFAVREPAVEK